MRSDLRLTSTGQRRASRPGGRAIPRTRAETTLRKALPDVALVRTTGKRNISIEDGVTSLDEVGAARLAVMSSVRESLKRGGVWGRLTAPCRR
jgi:hypothetical protein